MAKTTAKIASSLGLRLVTKQFVRAVFPVAFATQLLCGNALADAASGKAGNAPEFSFCFNDFPPYTHMSEEVPYGISIDVVREAARRNGWVARLSELPWNRCLDAVRNGAVDAVMDAAERPDFLQGPSSYNVYSNTLWVRADSPLQKFHAADFVGLVVGLVDGYDYPDELLAMLKNAGASFDYSVDDQANAQKLAFGRFDALIGDHAATAAIATWHGLGLRALPPTPSADRLYVSFNLQKAEAQGQFDRTLAAMLADGTVDAVYRRHLGVGLCEIWPALTPDRCPVTAQAAE